VAQPDDADAAARRSALGERGDDAGREVVVLTEDVALPRDAHVVEPADPARVPRVGGGRRDERDVAVVAQHGVRGPDHGAVAGDVLEIPVLRDDAATGDDERVVALRLHPLADGGDARRAWSGDHASISYAGLLGVNEKFLTI
jgi:hypothetical protein